MSSDPAMRAIFGEVGYDFVIADMEHGRVDLTNLLVHVYAARATGTVLLVRVPENDPSLIQRTLVAAGSAPSFPPPVSLGWAGTRTQCVRTRRSW